MCNFYDKCSFRADKCHYCCICLIKNSYKLSREIIGAWSFLYGQYNSMMRDAEQGGAVDTKIYVISSYTLVTGIFHESIRTLFLEYFKTKGVEMAVLTDGKWLSGNMNVNKKLIESIFVTQKISFGEMQMHMDALDFFTKNSLSLHRNKAAHDAVNAIQAASKITLNDVFRQFITMMHCVVCF